MEKNKFSLIVLMLLSTSVCYSYTDVSVLCRVNNSALKEVSCDDGWVEMRSYPEVELRLKDCSWSRSRQKVEVKIGDTIYRPNSLSSLEIKYRVEEYLIECFDTNRVTGF